MNFSKENNDLKKEPIRRNSSKSSSASKKIYWKISERSSLVAILKHWATLSTLGAGVIAMVAVTVLFYRENKGAYYKSKFLSPIQITKSIEEFSESKHSDTQSNLSYTEYNPTIFNPSSNLVLSPLTGQSTPDVTNSVEKSVAPNQEVPTTAATRNRIYVQPDDQLVPDEELAYLVGLSKIQLALPAIQNPEFGPKLPADYVSADKKSRLIGRFRIGAEVGFGLSSLNVRDARMDDSQVVGDVKVKPELAKSYGFVLQAQITPHVSVSTGIYESSYQSEIIPRFIPDTTGGGFNWPPPPPGEEEEHHEEEEHGSGEHVIQFADGGYDIVTNAGVTHVSHDMDEDLAILSGSKEYFTYYTIPVTVNYGVRYRKFNIELGTGINFNQLKHSYAQFNVLDDNKFSTQQSDIIGLKAHYLSQSLQLGVQYKLTYNLSVGASFKYNYAWSTMNESTPFNTHLNSWSGMAGVYYNF